MSVPAGNEGVVEAAAGTAENQPGPEVQSEQSFNPAWSPVMDVLPETLRPLVTPHLQKWDSNYQELATAHAPFKELLKSGVTPDQISEAMNVRNILLENPRIVYDRMNEQFGWNKPGEEQKPETVVETPPPGESDGLDFDITQHPKFKELSEQNQVIAQYLIAEKQRKEQEAEDATLNQEWTALQGKNDLLKQPTVEKQVFALAAQFEMPLAEAAEMVLGSPVNQTRTPAPATILPTSGGVPSSAVDVASMSGEQTRELVRNYIEALHRAET